MNKTEMCDQYGDDIRDLTASYLDQIQDTSYEDRHFVANAIIGHLAQIQHRVSGMSVAWDVLDDDLEDDAPDSREH
jgi:hypothetical protein